jgi:hypothetical protein
VPLKYTHRNKQTGEKMTTTQIANLRKQINAAWNANNKVEVDRLTNILRGHTVDQANQFVQSQQGQSWTNDYLMNRP